VYINQIEVPGVFYVRSEDQGATWSAPVWIDPDILPSHVPDSLSFELDSEGGLHAVWFYATLNQTVKSDWVRYAHSLDGGDTWSSPFLLDQNVEAIEHSVSFASPVMIVQAQTVHVIWAAGELPYRVHRYSTDRGQTWSVSRRPFGELHGQAFDGLTVDGAGRVHFVGQIRFPLAIYHAYWEQGRWTPPALIYLIAQEGEEIRGDGVVIHAHDTHPVVRAGNQLVLTLADSPGYAFRRLFAMQRMLDGISPRAAAPTPTPLATPSPMVPATPLLATPAPILGRAPRWDLAIWVAIVPTLALLTVAVLSRLILRARL
jgi:hypothetical protein